MPRTLVAIAFGLLAACGGLVAPSTDAPSGSAPGAAPRTSIPEPVAPACAAPPAGNLVTKGIAPGWDYYEGPAIAGGLLPWLVRTNGTGEPTDDASLAAVVNGYSARVLSIPHVNGIGVTWCGPHHDCLFVTTEESGTVADLAADLAPVFADEPACIAVAIEFGQVFVAR
jgi:hypothetical protein